MRGKRLYEVFKILKRKKIISTKKQFCCELGLNNTNFSKYGKGELNFKLDDAKKEILENRFGVNVNWLNSGVGEVFIEDEKNRPYREMSEFIKKFSNLNEYELRLLETVKKLNLDKSSISRLVESLEYFKENENSTIIDVAIKTKKNLII